ncbi:hypothetical protein TCON_2354 [Astathelohania contejeani]|uniref:Uncharacterized protein n=1 Tax=Astathelohania contejeani TaxID=164912 RepID=A0ABQ7HW88_9MICR|nr:hypothetical protein TCON_2354 [Thelohania contejeani]
MENKKIITIIYIISIIILTIYFYPPAIFDSSFEKEQKLLKLKYNDKIKNTKHIEYYTKIKVIINNYRHIRKANKYGLNIGELVDNYNLKNDGIVSRLYENISYNEDPIFLKYSLEYNLGIFLPVFLPIFINVLSVFRNI